MTFPHCSGGWTASLGAKHLQGKCQVLVFSVSPVSRPSAMENTKKGKILTHVRESTFFYKSVSFSRLVSRQRHQNEMFYGHIFVQLLSSNPLSCIISSSFHIFLSFINFSEFSEPSWTCWFSTINSFHKIFDQILCILSQCLLTSFKGIT